MRPSYRLVSVGAVRPPVAPAEPPSVAAGEIRGTAYLPTSHIGALPGHARPGRRHIYSPAGYCTGQAPTGVKPPFASLHRLSVQQSRVIVPAQGNHLSYKESVLLVESFDSEEQPGGGSNPPAGQFVGRVDVAGAQPTNNPGPGAAACSAASTLPTTVRA